MTNSYFEFYNQLNTTNTSINQLIETYMNYLCSTNDDFTCGFFGILQSSNFVPTYVQSPKANSTIDLVSLNLELQELHIPLITNDVHEDVFDLHDVLITNEHLREQYPYISSTHFSKLETLLFQACPSQQHTYLIFNILYNHYIVATLCFCSDKSFDLLHNNLAFYRFIKGNLETLITNSYLQEDILTNQRITETANLILDSKRYYSYDKSIVLGRLLDLAFELLDEPDYGSALLFENGSWSYVHAIGHDIDVLRKIRLPEEMHRFSSEFWSNYQEVAQHIYFIESILDTKETDLSHSHSDVIHKIKQVSKPIKQTLQLHLTLNNVLIGIISLDLKETSKISFTRKTIKVLTQLHYLGQFLLTYSSLAITSQSFEELTNLITRMISPSSIAPDTFLPLFLNLLVQRLYEVEYASAYIVDSDGIHFLATVGHDLSGLQSLPLKQHHFLNLHNFAMPIELSSDYGFFKDNPHITISLLTNLMNSVKEVMPEDLYSQYERASNPIKDSLVAQSKLEEDVYMSISVDIAAKSDSSFSKESVKLFKTLINLGFSFISNQYYISKYQALNNDLAYTVEKKTQALKDTNKKLRSIAKKDSLTGLLNHRNIIAKLTGLISNKKPLSILLFDIDHFKLVNDLYGHQVGDSVLLKISQLLGKEENIISGRYGGEEFLIILPDMNMPEAIIYCQTLLNKIENYNFVQDHKITVSGGVVTHKKGTSTEIIQVADALLYKAKHLGRNQLQYGVC
jgi:diguanylate cyclase (GGDEF)-like protein